MRPVSPLGGSKPQRVEHVCPPPADGPKRPALLSSRIHMLGIGGCGMSGLARMLAQLGARVDGRDAVGSPVTEGLRSDGIGVAVGVEGAPLEEDVEVVIASAAVKPDHPAVLEAMRRGLAVLSYAEALGELSRVQTAVAVAGTHGKSTVTAMLGATLADCGLDPSVIVGATSVQLSMGSLGSPVFAAPAGYRVGAAEVPAGPLAGEPGLLLAEACEFNRSFHNLRPKVAAITSIEADHLDVYGSLEAIIEAFGEFARLLPSADEGGLLLIAHEGAHRREVAAGVRCRVETVGFSPEADWVVGYDPQRRTATLTRRGGAPLRWGMRMPGQHNAMNAAFALALAISLGGEGELAARSISAFRGLERRTQLLGERTCPDGGRVRVYDDYGHHPTAIEATLRALREAERPQDQDGRLVCVFQPHQHSRTRFLLEEFASAFGQADVVIVPHIYFVRDSLVERQKVTAGDLVDRLRQRGVRAMHLYPFEAIIEQLENLCRGGDLLVVMGAGPVWQVARGYLEAGGERGGD